MGVHIQPEVGHFPVLFDMVGVDWNHYLNGNQAIGLVVFAAAWKQIACNVLLYLAVVQSIPRSAIEAAAIDGAGPIRRILLNSLMMALMIALGKIAILLISAFAIVYFRFPFPMGFCWMIFITLMLTVEARILPTVEVVADLGMLNSYWKLSIPLQAHRGRGPFCAPAPCVSAVITN